MTSVRRSARNLLLVVALAMVATMVTVRPASAAGAVDIEAAEQRFVDLTNATRAAEGVGSIRAVADVTDVARAWSERMAADRELKHNPAYASQFCCWLRAAENVGWASISDVNDQDQVLAAVQRLHDGFLNSPGHRVNIVHGDHNQIGIAIHVEAGSCPNGQDCVWVTQNFRDWDGSEPAGGLRDAYGDIASVNTDDPAPAETSGPRATVSDDVHEGGFDGDVTTTERLGATKDTAVEVATARFDAEGASHAVLSRDDRFPDSLAGAPLTAEGPLLFTPTATLSGAVARELTRSLAPGATVYLLGGPVALDPAIESAVEDLGFTPKRLAGESRVDTALVIADEVRRLYGDNGMVVVARDRGTASDPDGPAGWVDSITGGAWAAANRVPVVITPSADLAPAVQAWLAKDRPTTTYLLGGEVALSSQVATRTPNARRISGENRAATAVAVAEELWRVGNTDRRFIVLDGWGRSAWQDGLAAAGLAADQNSPLVLASDDASNRPAETVELVTSCDQPAVDLVLVGPLGDAVADWLEAVDGAAC